MEDFADEILFTEAGAQVHHGDVETVVAVAEVTQVDEVAPVAREDGVGELEVPMDGGGGVRGVGDKPADGVFLRGREKGILREKAVIAVFHVLELGRIHLHLVKVQAHLGELGGELSHLFGFIGRGAGVGFLALDAPETDAETHAVGDIVAGFRAGDAQVKDLPGHQHFVQGLLDLARIVEFEHDGGVFPVIETFTVGSFPGVDIVVQVDSEGFHEVIF